MVIANTRHAAADPDEQEQEREHLDEEPDHSPEPTRADECGPGRTTEEERDDDGCHRDGVHELSHEEKGETDRAVFGVVAADQFLFSFDEIERRTVEFGLAGQQEHNERNEAGSDEVPVRNEPGPPGARLGHDDAVGAQCARHEHHRADREAEGGFVGNHLG